MSLEEYFSTGEPLERAVYDAVRAQLDGLRPLTVEFVSVGIFFKRARTFAELRPKRDRRRRLELSFLVSRALEHPRFARSWRGTGQRSAYFVDLHDAREVDDEVRDWLTEAFLASPD
jgi:predicted transport protein